MSLSDLFCVERHKSHFLDLVKNRLDIIFANEQEILSLTGTSSFDDAIAFCKQVKKILLLQEVKMEPSQLIKTKLKNVRPLKV